MIDKTKIGLLFCVVMSLLFPLMMSGRDLDVVSHCLGVRESGTASALNMNGLTKGKGYYPGHDIEGPDEAAMSLGLEDNRNTLLWLPRATAEENGEMEFEFYASDISSLFSIVCLVYELNGNGIGEASKLFKVLNPSK